MSQATTAPLAGVSTRDLHRLVLATILSLLVMSLGINLFIFVQMRAARTQLAVSRTVERDLARQYQIKEPAMRRFVGALQAFALAHPDFQPILQRYRAGLPQFFTDLEMPTRTPDSLKPK